ncbi:RNA polymerase subunit sigma, partial [Klebsiella pneumoniae]|nr:RNA polymerase subunit sigma [Klebsiella pneumoniae]
ISTSNYHTIMYRARESLRQCLQIKWFNQENPQ